MSFQTCMTYFRQFQRIFKQLFSIKTTGCQTPKGKKTKQKKHCASVGFVLFVFVYKKQIQTIYLFVKNKTGLKHYLGIFVTFLLLMLLFTRSNEGTMPWLFNNYF